MNVRRASPIIIILGIAFLFFFPILTHLQDYGGGDWDYICSLNEIGRASILDYGQFPLWNPYASGGRPLLANPQDGFPRPTFFLTLIFGCVIGMKLELVLLAFIGMVGMFVLARHLGATTLGSILAATVFGLTNYFSTRVAEGHFNFSTFFWLPLIVFFFLKSFDDKKNLLYAALFLAFCIFGGGAAHTVPIISIFLLTLGFFMTVQGRSARPIVFVALILLLALAFSAFKALPILENVYSNPRPFLSPEVIMLDGLRQIFLSHDPPDFPGRYWGWQENAAYVGFVPLFLALIGLFRWWPKSAPLGIVGALGVLIGMGDFAPWTPWHVLHSLPFINSLHVPARFFIMAVFAIALLAGLAVSLPPASGRATVKRNALRALVLLVVLFSVTDLFISGRGHIVGAFPNAPISVARHDSFRQVMDANTSKSGAYSSLYVNMLANNGTLNAYEPVPQHVSAKAIGSPGYLGEAYLSDGGEAYYSYWSPNKLVVSIRPKGATRLVINQNYDWGWRVRGGQAESFNGLLSTQVGPGDTQVTFYYLPSSFIMGILVSLVSVLLFIYWDKVFGWIRKRTGKAARVRRR